MPERINADNGPPWGNRGQEGITQLGAWLIRLGIRLSHSRPLHPQTNGKEERFHRTMEAELLSRHQFRDLDDAQKRLARWRNVYNFERPHQSLDMQTPSSRYRPSIRSMPKQLPPIEYLEGDLVRQVQQGGWIALQGMNVRVGKGLVGQPVACRPLADQDGEFAIFFCHHKVGEISLRDRC